MRTKLSFQEALQAFNEFLVKEGHSADVVWIFREDVLTYQRRIFLRWPLPRANKQLAEQLYEFGRDKGLGLKLEVFCWLRTRSCCYGFVPEDEDEAEYAMMTELKFSVPVEKRYASKIRMSLLWRAIARFVSMSKLPSWRDFIPERKAIFTMQQSRDQESINNY